MYSPVFERVYGFLYIPNELMLKCILKYTNLESYTSSGVTSIYPFYIHVLFKTFVLEINCTERAMEKKKSPRSVEHKAYGRGNFWTLVQCTGKHCSMCASSDAHLLCIQISPWLQVWSWTELTFDLEEIHIFFNSMALWDQKSVCYRLFSSTDWISLIWLWSHGEFNSLLLMKLNYFLSNCRWITLPELCCEVLLKR